MARMNAIVQIAWLLLASPPPPPPSAPVCVLEAVWFDFNESRVRQDAQVTLTKNAKCINERGRGVRIEGHAPRENKTQSAEYLLALGERRASAVKRFLEQAGVKGGSLKTISYGDEKPLCKGATHACRAKNRRVELHFE